MTDELLAKTKALSAELTGYPPYSLVRERRARETLNQLAERILELRETLTDIADWKTPETGKFYESGEPMSYGYLYGSMGEQYVVRSVARKVLLKDVT